MAGIRSSESAVERAVVNRQRAKTIDFMLGGARAYASSYPVMFTNISEMAPRMTFGSCHQIEIGDTPSQVDA